MTRQLSKTRRWARTTHKWIGLVGLVFFVLMALSGIGLNHPDLIEGFDLPRKSLPGDYEYRDWNRVSLRGVVARPGPAASASANGAGKPVPGFIFGEAGVWDLRGGGVPTDFNEGLPTSYYRRDVRALLLLERENTLLAGTRGGLYRRRLGPPGETWRKVELPENGQGAVSVVALVAVPDGVVALTRSNLYRAATPTLEFKEVALSRTDDDEREESLFRLIFEVHGGGAWGLPGRLVVDLVGLTIIFFSVTGGWFWWRRKRKTLARGRSGRLVRKGLKLHIRAGAWLALPILVVALTGAFERPPLLIFIADATYPASFRITPHAQSPWHDKLRKALYDPVRDVLVISTADGYYVTGQASLASGEARLHPMRGGPPVSVMGATVFERLDDGSIVVGSMSGLYMWNRSSHLMFDLYTGGAPKGRGRPVGERKIMGCYSLFEPLVCADYDAGLTDRQGRVSGPPMPEELKDGGRISLWHFLFELHNGRLLSFLLGWWTWIVVPILGLALAFEVLSGLWERFGPRKRQGA
jgi:hypothetical protein